MDLQVQQWAICRVSPMRQCVKSHRLIDSCRRFLQQKSPWWLSRGWLIHSPRRFRQVLNDFWTSSTGFFAGQVPHIVTQAQKIAVFVAVLIPHNVARLLFEIYLMTFSLSSSNRFLLHWKRTCSFSTCICQGLLNTQYADEFQRPR